MHDPSVSQSRPRLGCFLGTFSPSRRQIRSTRLSLMSQPAGAAARRSCGSRSVRTAEQDDVGAEPLLVVSTTGDLALRRAMLAERRAGATLGYTQLPANVLDADPATRGA
jgi:hypothetical protein